jgi:hypothetical protein
MKAIQLTASDWAEIFAALLFKRDHSPATTGDARWQEQLSKILRRIGPDGCEAARRGVRSSRHDEWTVILLLPDTHTDNFGQDTEVVHVNGRTMLKAVRNARRRIITKLNDPDLKEDDLFIISVFNGRQEDMAGQWLKLHRETEKST